MLFEQLLDLPPDAPERATLFANEPTSVMLEIVALEAAEVGATDRFATASHMAADMPAGPRPARVGAYRLVEMIGEGGMGEVWKAVRDDGLFDHVVAVKLIRPGILSAAATARFVEERRLLARLEHAGIARLIDGGVSDGGWPYLITEFVAGRPIDIYCREEDLPLPRRVALVREAARAIQAAHSQLIVHADIKPANLLVTRDEQVKLLDFGIARLSGGEDEDDGSLRPMTRAYSSPQRLAGAAPGVTDDVFAAGILLRDLAGAEGQRDDLGAIVAHATAADPAGRYSSMEAFGADLDRWRARLPVAARPATIAYHAQRFVARHWLGVSATLLALLLLVAATVIATGSYVRAEHARAAETARVADLRRVAHYLLYDLQGKMAQRPNSLALRTEIAGQSQAYLDKLAAQADASPAMRMEAADGLTQLAQFQGKPARASLGQTDRTRRNLERAAQLLTGLRGDEPKAMLARIRIEQAAVSTMIDNDLPRSETLLRDAAGLIAQSGKAGATHMADYLLEVALLREWQNRYPEAIALAHRAATAPAPADPHEAIMLAARIQDVLGESTYYAGDKQRSILFYRRQMALLETAAARWPQDSRTIRALARSRWALGAGLMDVTPRSAEAMRVLDHGSHELAALVAYDREDADAARMFDIIETARAQALAFNGRSREGIALMAESAGRRRRAWLANPRETMRLRDYAIGSAALGDMQAEHKLMAQACANYLLANSLFMRLAALSRLSEADRVYSVRLLDEGRARRCTSKAALP